MSNIFNLFRRLESDNKSIQKKQIAYIVVGLGNPGNEYELTRHNSGFMAIDYFAEKIGVKIDRAKFNALYCDAEISGIRALLIKPQTYMNNSGSAVKQFADYYKIPTENIIVISDDISLPVGRIRIRKNGSDGGQKGLKDIIRCLKSDNFPRVRIGVGEKPDPKYELSDWVLSKFTDTEKKILVSEFSSITVGIEQILNGDIDRAMSFCNTNKQELK